MLHVRDSDHTGAEMRGQIASAIIAAAVALLISAMPAGARSEAPGVPHYTVARYPAVTPRYSQFDVVDPGSRGVLYVGEAWSRDGGTTWAPAPIAAGDHHVYGFATGRRLVYRVDVNGAVDRSRDGGKTWARRGVIPSGLEHGYGSVTVEPFEMDVVCLQYVAGSPSGLPDAAILSNDGGATWRSAQRCNSFTSSDASTLVADATPSTGVTISTDGGRAWASLANDLPSGDWHLVADPSTPRSLYARGSELFEFHSSDGGTTWTPLAKPPVDATASTTVLVDPARPGAVVVSQRGHLWLSRDHGASWKLTSRQLPDDPSGFDAAGTLYILSSSPMRSADDGMTWVWSSHGLGGASPRALAVDPTNGAPYLVTSGGLLRLAPDRKTWRSVSPVGMAATPSGLSPQGLVVTDGTSLVLTTDGGVIRSTTRASSFTEVDTSGPLNWSSGPPLAVVGTTSTIVGSGFGHVSVSDDSGRTWTQRAGADPSGGIAALAQPHGSTPATLFEATYTETGDFAWSRSFDLGITWHQWLTVPTHLEMVAATANAEYFAGTLASEYGPRGLAIDGSAMTLHQLPLFDDILVTQVATSLAHPALAVVLGADRKGELRSFLTKDSGATWKQLSPPVGRYCSPIGAALTPDDRLVVAFTPVGTTRTGDGFACLTASIVSTPLTR